jgi:hypothetical protein
MANSIADAPVRANKAPPKAKATQTPPSAPAPPAANTALAKRAVSEASCAASEAIGSVSVLLCEIVENDDFKSHFKASAELFCAAELRAAKLAYGDENDQLVEVGPSDIAALSAAIETAMSSLDIEAQGGPLGAALVVAILALHAQNLLMRISDALEASAATLGPLQALNTYTGVRPFREQPRLPIHCGPCEQDIAASANAFAEFGTNMPGHLIFDNLEELQRFVTKTASQNSCLNIILAGLVDQMCMSAEGPEPSFVADFATFVSDQIYAHQMAVGALLKAGAA